MADKRRSFKIADIVLFSDDAFQHRPGIDKFQSTALGILYQGVKLRVVNVRKAEPNPFMPKRKQLLRVDPIDAKLARTTFWIDNLLYGTWWDDTWFRLA
jgi:hypothetical protein